MEQDQKMEVPLVASGSVEQECGIGKSPVLDSHGYVLRENPKKSWKFSGSSHDVDDVSMDRGKKVQCKICRKEFASQYSLNGHLKLHSCEEKTRVRCGLCGSRFKSPRGLYGHMKIHSGRQLVYVEYGVAAALSDAETMNLVRKKRSKRARYKSSSSDLSGFSESVSGFKFDHVEEEVAESLLLLSSGAGLAGWSSFVSDSIVSNSTSVSCGDGSLPEEGGVYVSDDDGNFKIEKAKNERFGSRADSEMVTDERDQLDHIIELASGVGDEGTQFRCEANKEDGEDVTCLAYTNSISDCDVVMGNSPTNFVAKVGSCHEDPKFKCKIRSRMFATPQSLGGHQTSHRLTKCSSFKRTEVCESQLEGVNRRVRLERAEPSVDHEMDDSDEVNHRLQTPKDFKCSVCCKIFPSGQALGGHKRAHWAARASNLMQHDVADISQLMELDIPCLVDSEANCDVQLEPLWAGSSLMHEAPVGIVG